MHVYGSRGEIEQALKTSEIMATPELSYESQSDRIKSMYAEHSYAINNGVYALFNMRSEITKDKPVREALSLSVNRQKLISKLSSAADFSALVLAKIGFRLSSGPSTPSE